MTLKLNQTLHSVCYIYAHVCFSHSLHLAAHHSLSLPVSQKETCWSLFSARKQKKGASALGPYMRVTNLGVLDKDRRPCNWECVHVSVCAGSLQPLTDHFQTKD